MSGMHPLQYFVCGGFGGICNVLVGHPLDTIKVRLQTMPIPKSGEQPLYSGTLDCLKKTIHNEGFRGLYKGMGAPLASIAPIFAISFFGYGLGKRIFGPKNLEDFKIRHNFLAGAFSGIFTTSIMAPGERIKCLLQTQQGANQPKLYNGPIDCAIKLYKQGGIGSIYRGAGATLVRDIPASGLYFAAYEIVQKFVTNNGEKDASVIGTIFAGGAAGMAYWIAGMPADVVKSRLQTAPEGTYPNGARDVLKQLLVKEGPLALYKGITPVFLRAFPANAACFVGFEICRKFLNRIFSLNKKPIDSEK